MSEKKALTPEGAVELIGEAGGVAVIAHPVWHPKEPADQEKLVELLAGHGLAGIEVDHPDHDAPTRERDDAIKYANSSLLERLLPIVDNFELGLSAARGEGEDSPVFSGMSMVLKQLSDFLSENGLRPIDAVGHKFDPNLHEAIAHEPSDEVAEGKVIRQTRRGYRLKDRLLRPATVVVSSGRAD